MPFFVKINGIHRVLNKVLKVLKSRHASDERKEGLIPVYACQMMSLSILILFYILIIVGGVFVLSQVASVYSINLMAEFITKSGIGLSVAVPVIYIKLRKRLHSP